MEMGLLDHWVWTVPDLSTGAAWIQQRLGPTYFGGRHKGLGSANHILPLNDCTYLEVIGPSEEIGLLTSSLKSCRPRIATFAIRLRSLERVADAARAVGLSTIGPQDYTRIQANGAPLSWRLLELRGHRYGDYLPFFIEWGSSTHPSTVLQAQVSVESFVLVHPSVELPSLYASLGVPVAVQQGPPLMTLTLRTPSGAIMLEGRGDSAFLAVEH
jgi:hypothetical protein